MPGTPNMDVNQMLTAVRTYFMNIFPAVVIVMIILGAIGHVIGRAIFGVRLMNVVEGVIGVFLAIAFLTWAFAHFWPGGAGGSTAAFILGGW